MRPLTACLVAGLLAGAGCAEQPRARRALAQPYQPANLHRAAASLPASLRRVAVLPLATPDGSSEAASAAAGMETILLAELRKRAAFEVVPVSRDQLRLWTGRADWRREESLPADLLNRIQERTGSEGVLFSGISTYRPYPPLAVGWSLQLVDAATGASYWTVDEVFDAGSVEVIKSAQAYARAHMNQPALELDSTGVLSSPSRFGQYTAAAVVGTLQPR